jgi:hypothetical protein
MANKYIKKCFLCHKRNSNKTALRFQFTWSAWQTTNADEDAGDKEPLFTIMHLVQPLWQSAWRILEKLKTKLPKEWKSAYDRYLHTHVCSSTVHNNQSMESA